MSAAYSRFSSFGTELKGTSAISKIRSFYSMHEVIIALLTFACTTHLVLSQAMVDDIEEALDRERVADLEG